MIGKSLANDFQYTKLKYKQYLQFKYTTYVSFMFLFIQFISPCFFFVYLSLSFSLNLIHFYLIYYQESIIKLSVLYTVEIARFFRKKQETKQLFLLFLATKRLCSLLITGRHYSLLVIQISSRSQISSRQTNFQQKSCQCELQICQ